MAQAATPLRVAMKHPDPAQCQKHPELCTLDWEARDLLIKQSHAIKNAFFDGGLEPVALTLLFVLRDFDARPAEMAAKTFLEERGFIFLTE
jgi:hypothetical protein